MLPKNSYWVYSTPIATPEVAERRFCGSLYRPYKKSEKTLTNSYFNIFSELTFRYPKAEIHVYTGDVEVTPVEILEKVKKNMNVNLKNIKFIYLNKRKWVEGDRYPAVTLLCQALGSMYLAYEALNKLVPGKK